MNQQQQEATEKFGNSIASLLVKCKAITFKMNLQEMHVSVDFEYINTELLEKTANEIDQLTEKL